MLGQIQLDLARAVMADRAASMLAERRNRDPSGDGPHRRGLRSFVGTTLISVGLKLLPKPQPRPQTNPPC